MAGFPALLALLALHALRATYFWHSPLPHYLPPTRFTQPYLATGPQQGILLTICTAKALCKPEP